MDPDHGATNILGQPVVFAQLTVASGTGVPSGTISAQGRSDMNAPDWEIDGMQFGGGGGAATPPPPPPRPPPPPPRPPPPAPGAQVGGSSGCTGGSVCPVLNQVSTAKAGYTTYQVAVAFDRATTADV